MADVVLAVERLSKTFASPGRGGRPVRAVADVSFELRRGETLGLVGESGCGKSTLSRLILSLVAADGGEVRLAGHDFSRAAEPRKRELRRRIQIVFQDALSSLNPRMTVAANVAEPLRLQGLGTGASRRAEAVRLLDLVGIGADRAERYPHEFSGGQCQRIAIARALILKPEILVFDEAVSALDVSIRAQILRLIGDLQSEFGLSYVFVSHDLGVIRRICDRVAVMYLGRIVEIGPAEDVCRAPRHPYTAALLGAIPIADPRRMRVEDLVLVADDAGTAVAPNACSFAPRCPRRFALCGRAQPGLIAAAPSHQAACYLNDPSLCGGSP